MALLSLVRAGRFSAAERLRAKLLGNCKTITPRPEFAHVALACLRNRQLTGAFGAKLAEYVAWLHLVPDRHHTARSPFDAIVDELVHRASIPKFTPFFTHTALIIAHKGYADRHFLALARPVVIHSIPNSPAIHALRQMEHYATHYEQRYQLSPTPVARFIRTSLIQLFLDRGWPYKSLDLLLAPRTYTLPDEIYDLMLNRLPRQKSVILENWTTPTPIVPSSAAPPLSPTTDPPPSHPPHST